MTLPFTTGRQWPPAEYDELRRLYALGWTSRAIADALNRKFENGRTRNAVIGIVHRHFGDDERRQRASAPREIKARQGKVRAQPRPATIRAAAAPAPPPTKPQAPIADTARPWTSRKFGECAYPVDGLGADTLSCCAPCPDHTYCAAHRAVMFTKPPAGLAKSVLWHAGRTAALRAA